MKSLEEKAVAILATHGFERSELVEPRRRLGAAGARVHVLSPKRAAIRAWDGGDWGDRFIADIALEHARVEDYDALVLPGGRINPDILRIDPGAVSLISAFFASDKPVAAICHAPWLLIEADLVRGRTVTSYRSLQTDLVNAGANWVDEPVVVDYPLITSRGPADLPAFCERLIEALAGAGELRKAG